MKQTSIIAAIEQQERLSLASGELSEERAAALDHYLGRPYGNEVDGRSQVVMRDVADTVEWIKPSLMKVFCSGDEVVTFDPFGPEDVQQAEQETAYVNHILMSKNNGFLVLHDWFHDALVQKTGYVMVQSCTEPKPSRESYKGLFDDELAKLAEDEPEFIEHTVYDNGYGPQHDVIVRQNKEYHYTKVQNIAPERVLVASDWGQVDLQGCPFVEVIDYPTISQLREDGFDVDDTISDTGSGNEDDKFLQSQRSVTNDDNSTEREDLGVDPATRRVRTRYVWMNFDSDGDGIAELRRIVIVGTTILEDEEDDFIPVAAITPMRIPHEHYGQSVDDIVNDLQLIRTTLTRGFLDNMYLANNGRYAIDANMVNMDDMLVSRPGGVVRVNGPVGAAIAPLLHPTESGSILQAIEYVDTVRENRTGVTKYNQGLDSNSLNKTAHGVSQIMNASQQRIELIARIFAETGVKCLMLLIHAVSIKNGRKVEMVKLRNQWIPVDPREWKTRRDVTVSVGLGTGNKDQQLQHLMVILQAQQQAIQIGVASPQNIYNALVKLTQNAGFKNAEDFWTDPAKQPPAPPQPNPDQIKAQADVQKTQAQLQADQQKTQAQLQADAQKFQAQAQLDQMKMENEANEKERDRQLQLAIKQMDDATKLAIAEMQAKNAAALQVNQQQADREKQANDINPVASKVDESTKNIGGALGEVVKIMEGLRSDMNKPRIPVRDKGGKVIGSKTVDAIPNEKPDALSQIAEAIGGLRQDINRPRIPIRKDGKVVGSRPAQDGEL